MVYQINLLLLIFIGLISSIGNSEVKTITTNWIQTSASCYVGQENANSNSIEVSLPSDGIYKYLGADIENYSANGNYNTDINFNPSLNKVIITAKSWASSDCLCLFGITCSGSGSWVTIRANIKYDDSTCAEVSEPEINGKTVIEAKDELKKALSGFDCAKKLNSKNRISILDDFIKRTEKRLFSNMDTEKQTLVKLSSKRQMVINIQAKYVSDIAKFEDELNQLQSKYLKLKSDFRNLQKLSKIPSDLTQLENSKLDIYKNVNQFSENSNSLKFQSQNLVASVNFIENKKNIQLSNYSDTITQYKFNLKTITSPMLTYLNTLILTCDSLNEKVQKYSKEFIDLANDKERLIIESSAQREIMKKMEPSIQQKLSVEFAKRVQMDFTKYTKRIEPPKYFLDEYLAGESLVASYSWCLILDSNQAKTFDFGCKLAKNYIDYINKSYSGALADDAMLVMKKSNIDPSKITQIKNLIDQDEFKSAYSLCDAILNESPK